jgi:heptosyltransferase-2
MPSGPGWTAGSISRSRPWIDLRPLVDFFGAGPTSTTMETLVIAPNWVGDTVLALPVLDALGASGRRLTVLAKPHLCPLLSLVPSIGDSLARSSTDRETIEALRDRRFAEAVVLPNSFRSAWLPYRGGIPRRWGYGGRFPSWSFRSPLLGPSVRRPRVGGRHQSADYQELLAAMGVPTPDSWQPRLDLSAEKQARGSSLLHRAQVTPGSEPIVGLFAGAEFGPSKRWPWRRFVSLARELRRSRPGLRIVLIAGPKELWLAVRIHEETGKIHPVVGPDLDLADLAAVLSRLDLLITNDSGPMHLAASLQVPCLALFGSTNPSRTRPVGHEHRVLYTNRWCSPCFRRRCPLLHHRCMRDLSVGQVVDGSAGLLDSLQG